MPGWVWDQQQADYDAHVESLNAYAIENHTTQVPATFKDLTGFGLGRWVAKQRADYRSGVLSEKRRVQISKVPGWRW